MARRVVSPLVWVQIRCLVCIAYLTLSGLVGASLELGHDRVLPFWRPAPAILPTCRLHALRGGAAQTERSAVSSTPENVAMAGEGGWMVLDKLDDAILARVRAGLPKIKQPQWNDRVRKVECVLSFDTPESPNGLFVSMENFQGYGADYVNLDHTRSGNPLYLNIKWKKVPKEDDAMKTDEKEAAPTKMAIGVEGGFDVEGDKFDYEKTNYLAVMPEKVLIPLPQPELPELVSMVVEGILKASDLSTDEEQVMAWEEKRQPSKYAAGMVQLDNGKKISPDPSTWVCEDSGIKENLWLNLHDGYIGSGRPQFDGSGGTGAALKHYQAEKEKGNHFPLAVKLGTITPNGADVYSYSPEEDDMVEDPELAKHLAHWGINMMQMEKTEKTMAELQIDINMKFDFDKICEAGKTLQSLNAPGFVGLKNLGNSCYMNSVVQVLCALPEVKARYQEHAEEIFERAPQGKAAEDLSTQMAKLAVGLLTDRYVAPVSEGGETGSYIAPSMFKFLVGKGHPEFSTGNQQDAYEYWMYLMEKLERAERVDGVPTTLTAKLFEFKVEARLLDLQSKKVKYTINTDRSLALSVPTKAAVNAAEVKDYEERNAKRQKGEGESKGEEPPVKLKVPMQKCLEHYGSENMIEDYMSPVTKQKGLASQTKRFASFPPYIMCHIRRYLLDENWRPKKMDALIQDTEKIDLEFLRAKGPQPGEELLPDTPPAAAGGAAPASNRVMPDEGLVQQLMSMGFAENGCRRAAVATKNAGADVAMEWVLQHMEDADFNDPLPDEDAAGGGGGGGGGGGAGAVSAEAVEMLMAMGFQKKHAEKALRQTSNDLERAGDWLLSRADMLDSMEDEPEASAPAADSSAEMQDYKPQYELVGMISHIGGNTGSGHYLCHIKKEGRWTIFNDRKVAVSEDPPLEMAYLYLYKSVGPA